MLLNLLQSLYWLDLQNKLDIYKSLFISRLWIKLQDYKQIDNLKLFKVENAQKWILFVYIETDEEFKNKRQITSYIRKSIIKEKLKQNWEKFEYMVLFWNFWKIHYLIWVDASFQPKYKISLFEIDSLWANRTLIESLNILKNKLEWWKAKLRIRFLQDFFAKQPLTEDFYKQYHKLFTEIEKSIQHSNIKAEEKKEFVLVNLNRLLFIHFLDKKGVFDNSKGYLDFKNKFKEKSNYIAYLYYKIYKENKDNFPRWFYKDVLSVLFFNVFNKSLFDRWNLGILFDEFVNLPYLNWWLFRKTYIEETYSLNIEDKYFEEFVKNILNTYNFTIEEDTPFDVSISVDPELLGYIFENIVSDRFEWWIFYTPRTEVDFMTRQAIVEFLSKKEKFKNKKEDLYKLVYPEKWWEDEQLYGDFTASEIKEIFENLENIKVVDPACGSGAFLVGMMQTILDIEDTLKRENENNYKKLELQEKTLFERKKQLIKNSLYGVDVKKWAVEIAKLRLWLSMIVDIENNYFEQENAKIEPLLPNFDFKIVQWDSLLNMIWDKIIWVDIKKLIDPGLKRKINEIIKLKKDFYDNKIKDEYIVKKQEEDLYISILLSKLHKVQNEIKALKSIPKQAQLFWKDELDKEFIKTLNKKIKILQEQEETYKAQLQEIKFQRQIPFAWAIDFAEIFVENGGFDIVMGNPPYVRQEMIEDPSWKIKDKKKYKDLLAKAVQVDFFDEVERKFWKKLKIWWRADLYIYFYFKWLKLLNEEGVFSFITSNSWLDVDFGSVLQEFLIYFVESAKIVDNSSQRSFKSADINTIITFFSAPNLHWNRNLEDINNLKWKFKFINFKKDFEEAVKSQNLSVIDGLNFGWDENIEKKTIKAGWISFEKTSCEDFRLVNISAKNLFLDGAEEIENKKWLNFWKKYKYVWNKWWWKFLRAPDIFFTILEKGKNKLVRLQDVAEIKRWFTTWVNDFFYLPSKYFNIQEDENYFQLISKQSWLPQDIKIEKEFLKPVIKSPRDVKSILIKEEDVHSKVLICPLSKEELKNKKVLKYINWGESMGFDKGSTVRWRKNWYELKGFNLWNNFFIQKMYNDTFKVYLWNNIYCWDTLYYGLLETNDFIFLLNSVLFFYFQVLNGRNSLWEWGMVLQVYEVNNLLLLKNIDFSSFTQKQTFLTREIKSIFEELGFDKNKAIREQEPCPLPDRKELDDIIFDELGLTEEGRKEVYWSVAELVKARLDKSKSV